MKRLIIILCLFSYINYFSQSKNDSLVNIIQNADKILFTFHKDLYKTTQKPGKSKTVWHEILINGKPNKKIIKKRVVLDSINKKKLINLIHNQTPESHFEGAFTSNPNYTIFIFFNGKWEFIDICFESHNYHFTKGIKINRKTFLASYEDWRRLEDYFRKLNFTYQLPKQKTNAQ